MLLSAARWIINARTQSLACAVIRCGIQRNIGRTSTLTGHTLVTETEATEIKARMEKNIPGQFWRIVSALAHS